MDIRVGLPVERATVRKLAEAAISRLRLEISLLISERAAKRRRFPTKRLMVELVGTGRQGTTTAMMFS
jgi:hypothetical protein